MTSFRKITYRPEELKLIVILYFQTLRHSAEDDDVNNLRRDFDQIFEKYDTDRDGVVSELKFQEALRYSKVKHPKTTGNRDRYLVYCSDLLYVFLLGIANYGEELELKRQEKELKSQKVEEVKVMEEVPSRTGCFPNVDQMLPNLRPRVRHRAGQIVKNPNATYSKAEAPSGIIIECDADKSGSEARRSRGSKSLCNESPSASPRSQRASTMPSNFGDRRTLPQSPLLSGNYQGRSLLKYGSQIQEMQLFEQFSSQELQSDSPVKHISTSDGIPALGTSKESQSPRTSSTSQPRRQLLRLPTSPLRFQTDATNEESTDVRPKTSKHRASQFSPTRTSRPVKTSFVKDDDDFPEMVGLSSTRNVSSHGQQVSATDKGGTSDSPGMRTRSGRSPLKARSRSGARNLRLALTGSKNQNDFSRPDDDRTT